MTNRYLQSQGVGRVAKRMLTYADVCRRMLTYADECLQVPGVGRVATSCRHRLRRWLGFGINDRQAHRMTAEHTDDAEGRHLVVILVR